MNKFKDKRILSFLTKSPEEGISHRTIDNMDEPDKSIFILRYFYFEKVKDIGLKLNLLP